MYLKQYSSFRIQFDLTLFTLDSRKLYPRYAKSIWSPLYQLGRTMVVRTVTRLRTFCNKSVMTYWVSQNPFPEQEIWGSGEIVWPLSAIQCCQFPSPHGTKPLCASERDTILTSLYCVALPPFSSTPSTLLLVCLLAQNRLCVWWSRNIGLGTREVLIGVLALCVRVSGTLDTRRDLDRSDLRRHSIGIDSVTLSYGTDLLRRPCKSRVKVNNSLLKVR